jgi:hypothetical protein
MKKTHYIAVLIMTGVGILSVVVLALPKAAHPVTVLCCGTTNDPDGSTLYCFQVSNSMALATYGSYAVEVLHNGMWFNALPQPKGVGDFMHLPARTAIVFTVPAPSGRGEYGLQVQPDPPGEKWRTYILYTPQSHDVASTLAERLRRLTGNKNGSAERYSFSPEMSFAGANHRQPFSSDTNQTSPAAASPNSP